MNELELYKGLIMEHSRHPRNRGEFSEDMQRSRVYNALCGDDIEIGASFNNDNITHARFKGHACSICIASASMMTEVISNRARSEVAEIMTNMLAVFSKGLEGHEDELAEPLKALLVVRQHNSRKRCITLAWEALAELIQPKTEDSKNTSAGL